MPNGSESQSSGTEKVKVQTRARPWSGLLLGMLLGISLAVILQQAGVWPLDRLLLFGFAGLFGLIGILLTGWGRESASGFSSVVPLVLAVAMVGWGATGLTQLDEHGELNGGCTVEAQSDVDSTIMTDTTRQEPFEVDPEGGLSWSATSPAPITDHTWEIWVDVGGFQVVVAEGSDSNADQNLENSGDVPDISVYVEEVTSISGQQIRGVVEVGGSIDGDGGACDGFAFVRLTADFFDTLISRIAAALALISLIALITITARRTRMADVVPEAAATSAGAAAANQPMDDATDEASTAVETETQTDGGAMGAAKPDDTPPDDDEGFPPTT
ncbi:MAG TPA: hypothetical protein VI193_06850 [Acidimicrobiia bacterium]